jgi:hypothetical protein
MAWRVVRWVVAIPAAALGFIFGVVIVSVGWQHFGGAAGSAYVWSIAVGTILGTLSGTLIVPPEQRKVASHGFVGIVVGGATVLLAASIVEHTFKVNNVFDVLGSVLGGGIILRVFQRHGAKSRLLSS